MKGMEMFLWIALCVFALCIFLGKACDRSENYDGTINYPDPCVGNKCGPCQYCVAGLRSYNCMANPGYQHYCRDDESRDPNNPCNVLKLHPTNQNMKFYYVLITIS